MAQKQSGKQPHEKMDGNSAAQPYNVSPSDYEGYLQAAREHDRDLWENNGWGIRSIEGEHDTLIWTSPYHFRSRPEKGPFAFQEASILQSMVVDVKYTAEQKKGMNDNDFYITGWNGREDLRPPDDLSIRSEKDRTVWEIGDMTYEAAPPVWKVHGQDRELGYDFTFKADDPAIWMTDPARSAVETGDRWHMIYVDAQGKLVTPNRTIPVSGMAWHERHVHLSTTYDPASLLKGRGLVIHNAFSRDFQVFFLARPDLGVYRAKVSSPDGLIDFFGESEIRMSFDNHWVDPRSKFEIPCAWTIELENDKAKLTLAVTGFARSYYLWNNLRRGVNVLYWWLAESSGEWTDKRTGTTTAIRDLKHVVHANRTFFHYSN
ncbi:hypothetical protein M3223_15515 [Paenibacillus pasadenensis]|uniref:hypothetical protein n=1 Tax=Paenibacillus pasadenensis TaxID=217090 RepID=UPI00203F9389|nr:hypothetical protein [Paenibacillus pasadenensis]MCM3748760.1 hypothetical protein [Paenibacillus pasadenensis]